MCSMLLRDLLICASFHFKLCYIYVTMVTSLQYIRRLRFCHIERVVWKLNQMLKSEISGFRTLRRVFGID